MASRTPSWRIAVDKFGSSHYPAGEEIPAHSLEAARVFRLGDSVVALGQLGAQAIALFESRGASEMPIGDFVDHFFPAGVPEAQPADSPLIRALQGVVAVEGDAVRLEPRARATILAHEVVYAIQSAPSGYARVESIAQFVGGRLGQAHAMSNAQVAEWTGASRWGTYLSSLPGLSYDLRTNTAIIAGADVAADAAPAPTDDAAAGSVGSGAAGSVAPAVVPSDGAVVADDAAAAAAATGSSAVAGAVAAAVPISGAAVADVAPAAVPTGSTGVADVGPVAEPTVSAAVADAAAAAAVPVGGAAVADGASVAARPAARSDPTDPGPAPSPMLLKALAVLAANSFEPMSLAQFLANYARRHGGPPNQAAVLSAICDVVQVEEGQGGHVTLRPGHPALRALIEQALRRIVRASGAPRGVNMGLLPRLVAQSLGLKGELVNAELRLWTGRPETWRALAGAVPGLRLSDRGDYLLLDRSSIARQGAATGTAKPTAARVRPAAAALSTRSAATSSAASDRRGPTTPESLPPRHGPPGAAAPSQPQTTPASSTRFGYPAALAARPPPPPFQPRFDEQDMDELRKWLELLPPRHAQAVAGMCESLGLPLHCVVEVTLSMSSATLLTVRGGDSAMHHASLPVVSTAEDVLCVMHALDRLWAAYFDGQGLGAFRAVPQRPPFPGVLSYFSDTNRVGVPLTLHRVSGIRPPQPFQAALPYIGFTLRAGRGLVGLTEAVVPDALLQRMVQQCQSLLLVGAPCTGKTTFLRDLCRRLAAMRCKVAVVDASFELTGGGLAPHRSLGEGGVVSMYVPSREHQHRVMLEAVINHSPDVLVVDEIGRHEEVSTARDIARRGISLLATAHATSLADLVRNPDLVRLVGGRQSVALGDHMARELQPEHAAAAKLQLMRSEDPVFTAAIELPRGGGPPRVHENVAHVVDHALADLRRAAVE